METLFIIIGGLILLGIAISIAALLLVLLLGGKRKKTARPPSHTSTPPHTKTCPTCHNPLPPGSDLCPACDLTIAPPSTPRPAPITQSALIGLSGDLAQRVFHIPPAPGGLTIGRSPDNDVAIPDALTVSRYHAQIVQEGDVYVLYDRDSANGTVVNNQRVWRYELQDNDQIQIGGVRFIFSRSGQVPPHILTPSGPPAESSGLFYEENSFFEGYLLEKRLGQGGMSVVYRARDQAGNPVAIKILNVTDDYAVRKFIQEEQIGNTLRDHPYIRKVHRLGRSQSRNLYLVMEYVEGRPLRQLIGELADEEIVRIIGQTCVALHYAHERGVVHRDIKPENILISHDGVVKVTDFGIAKLTSSVTVTSDRVVGTPEYLSPEQAKGEQNIQPSTDIYSVGVVLYELLAGRVPFPLPQSGDPYQAAITVLRQHVETPPRPPREHNPRVTPHLEKIALRAIEKDPRKRYPTALALSEAMGYQEPLPPIAVGSDGHTEPLGGFHLVVLQGARAGRRISIRGESVVIGREDLGTEDMSVSRKHAVLSLRGGQLWLEDTSLNGTFVNGERVFGQIRLHPGDEIRMGKSVLSVTP